MVKIIDYHYISQARGILAYSCLGSFNLGLPYCKKHAIKNCTYREWTSLLYRWKPLGFNRGILYG